MVPEGSEDDAMQQLWWEGVRKWYNDEDYEGAMNAWTLALFRFARTVGCHRIENNDHDDYDRWLSENVDEDDDLRYLSMSMSSNSDVDGGVPSSEREPFFSPLWLFLAGCWLDAGRYSVARKCLRVCLRDCCLRVRSKRQSEEILCDTVRRALLEYAASFEEENPARSVLGRQIFEVANANLPSSRASRKHALPWSNPYQRPGYLHPNLPSQPFYDGADRPAWCEALEGQYSSIRREFDHLYATSRSWPRVGQGDHRDGSGMHDGRVVSGGDWREIVLFGSGAANENVAPFTRKWIRAHLPEAVDLAEAGGGEVIFSVLQPRTALLPHCATTNVRLTAHLGLVIPNEAEGKCRIRVGSRWETWEEGKVLVFDDSFEHEVENSTDQMRAVLLIRFWHPQLSDRSLALHNAVEAKRMDEVRRYNPPLPNLDDESQVRRRALEQSQCSSCWNSGHTSIRVLASGTDMPCVQCVCGSQISDEN